MKFGEFFKNIRTEKGLSQRQLAELSHISNTEISRIESGERRNPSPNILKSLAPHLGISYGELMIKAGYIDESIEHEKYTEHIFRKADGELADTIRLAKTIHDKD
ncbi:DNA-binding protein, partial [Clostridium butyricum]